MSEDLLDEDTSDLLKSKEEEIKLNGSGRKINQGGMSFLKSKYKKLQKFQTAQQGKGSSFDSDVVEHPENRGTIRVQSELNSNAINNSNAESHSNYAGNKLANSSSAMHSNAELDSNAIQVQSATISNADMHSNANESANFDDLNQYANGELNSSAVRVQKDSLANHSNQLDELAVESHTTESGSDRTLTPPDGVHSNADLDSNALRMRDVLLSNSILHSNQESDVVVKKAEEQTNSSAVLHSNSTPHINKSKAGHSDAAMHSNTNIHSQSFDLTPNSPVNEQQGQAIAELSQTTDSPIDTRPRALNNIPSIDYKVLNHELKEVSEFAVSKRNNIPLEGSEQLNEQQEPNGRLTDSVIKNTFLSNSSDEAYKNNSSANQNEFERNTASYRVQKHTDSHANRMQARRHSNAESSAKSNPIRMQNSHFSSIEFKIYSVAPSEKEILKFLFSKCSLTMSLMTPPIVREEILAKTGIPLWTVKSSISRLKTDELINIENFRTGRNGWTIYSLPQEVYNFFSNATSNAESSANLPSKKDSVFNNKEKETNSLKGLSSWSFFDLDFSKANPLKAVLVNGVIRKLAEESLTQEMVQSFVDRFISWMGTQKKISSPIGIFCDKLKEFCLAKDSPVLLCLTEEERAAELEFAQHIEQARLEMELINKAKIEAKNQQVIAEFDNWYMSSSEQEKIDLCPRSNLDASNPDYYKLRLREAYKELNLNKYP